MENHPKKKNNSRSTRSSKRTVNQLQTKKAEQAKLKELYHSSLSSVASNKTDNNSSIDAETRDPPTPQRITRSARRAIESTPLQSSSMSPIKIEMSANPTNDELNNITPDKAQDDQDASTQQAASTVEATPSELVETPSQRLARRKAHPLKDISEPLPTDCLFGRGGGTNHHPGNKLYRKMVEDKKEKYLHSKRLDKPLVAMEIITAWRELDPPGRFLKQDEVTKLWSDVGDKKAREKTSQALREKTGKCEEEEKETRFESGTKVQRGNLVARDHSLGTDWVEGGQLYSMEGFSWDESDNTASRRESGSHRDSGASNASSSREYYVRDHPPHYYGHPPPPPHHPSQYHSPYPPPPQYQTHHPYPPHHYPPQHHERGRNHSLSGHPLPGASTSKPAQNFDDERRNNWGQRSSYSYDGRVPPPLPPPYYYGHPPPPPHWGSPPPQQGSPLHPPDYYARPPPQSAFAPYGSADGRIQYYDAMSRPAGSPQDFTKIADLMSMEDDETKDEKMTRGNSASSNGSGIDRSNSWGGYERKHSLVARDSSIGTFAPFDALNEEVENFFDETVIQRSKSMPHPTAGEREASNGSSDDGFPSPPQPIQNRKKPECMEKEASPVEEAEKPSLMRKISGGGLGKPIHAPLDGVCRPEPVKRDTSNQPESMETKRSIKRVVLSRDKSAVSRHLKEEQNQKLAGSKLTKAEMLDRKLSVEINKLGLDERPMALDRITTDQVLQSLLDDDVQNSLLEPQPSPLTLDNRLDTIGAIANDIYSGQRTQSAEVDDALGLIMEDGDDLEAPSAVNEDIAAKWITGGSSFAEDDPKNFEEI